MVFEEFQATDKTDELLVGTTLGDRYEIVAVVASGGHGDVYKVRHLELERFYAAKIMHASFAGRPDAIRRFQREAQILCKLRHRNVVSVHSFGIDAKHGPFLIMDWLDGKPLSAALESEGALPLERATDLLMQICDGMAEAHAVGIVHRDLKPSNVMILSESDHERAVIIDFGSGKWLGSEAQKLTRTDVLMGTPLYMAPEQCSSMRCDERTDIYAMGCLMFEVFTGKPPFSGDSSFELMQKHLTETPPPLLVAKIPEQIANAIQLALKKDPEQRIESFVALKAALLEGRQDPRYSRTRTRPRGNRPAKRVNHLQLGLLLTATVCLMSLAAYWLASNRVYSQSDVLDNRPSISQLQKARNKVVLDDDYKKGIEITKTIVSIYRNDASQRLQLAAELRGLAELELHEKLYKDAQAHLDEEKAQLRPDDQRIGSFKNKIYLAEGEIALRTHRYADALLKFEAVGPNSEILEDEDRWRWHQDLAETYFHLLQTAKAIEQGEIALKIAPEAGALRCSTDALVKFRRAKANDGDIWIPTLGPDDPQMLDSAGLGQLHRMFFRAERDGNYEKAGRVGRMLAAYYEKNRPEKEEHVDLLKKLALIEMKLGNEQDARKFTDEANKIQSSTRAN